MARRRIRDESVTVEVTCRDCDVVEEVETSASRMARLVCMPCPFCKSRRGRQVQLTRVEIPVTGSTCCIYQHHRKR